MRGPRDYDRKKEEEKDRKKTERKKKGKKMEEDRKQERVKEQKRKIQIKYQAIELFKKEERKSVARVLIYERGSGVPVI